VLIENDDLTIGQARAAAAVLLELADLAEAP
jgi:hypothetical protein